MLKKDPWLDRAPSSSGQSVAPAHTVARRTLVGQREDLRCLRYPAARAPVGVSSSRRAVCARCCGRTLHGPKVRPKSKPACARATTVVGCMYLGTSSVKGIAHPPKINILSSLTSLSHRSKTLLQNFAFFLLQKAEWLLLFFLTMKAWDCM